MIKKPDIVIHNQSRWLPNTSIILNCVNFLQKYNISITFAEIPSKQIISTKRNNNITAEKMSKLQGVWLEEYFISLFLKPVSGHGMGIWLHLRMVCLCVHCDRFRCVVYLWKSIREVPLPSARFTVNRRLLIKVASSGVLTNSTTWKNAQI